MGRFDHIADDAQRSGAAVEPLFGVARFLEQAAKAMCQGRYEQALRRYGRALELERSCEEAWAGQARALLELGQDAEAATWLEQAVRVAGERPRFDALRASAAARQGKADEAMAWSDRAMRAGPDEATTWLGRAEVLYLRAESRPASRCLDKAYEREPGGETARRCGEVALGAGDLHLARTWLERARVLLPECPLVALRLGVYWERAGHLERARVELQRAVGLEPGLAPAQLALDDLAGRGIWAKVVAVIRRLSHGS